MPTEQAAIATGNRAWPACISRHQDGAIEPGDLKQLLSEGAERTEIRMIVGQREARAPLAEHLEAVPQQQVRRLASRQVGVATELSQRVRELVAVVTHARQRGPSAWQAKPLEQKTVRNTVHGANFAADSFETILHRCHG